jgi:hypothetical protein
MSERIERLRMGIETIHDCQALHERSVPDVEMFGKKTVWEGVVESFARVGPAKAKQGHAWCHPNKGETPCVNVLEIPPVVSPQTAVGASIVADAKARQ